MEKKEFEYILETGDFIHAAFCIQGECNFEKFVTVDGMAGGLWQLNDLTRGKFYIAVLLPDQQQKINS